MKNFARIFIFIYIITAFSAMFGASAFATNSLPDGMTVNTRIDSSGFVTVDGKLSSDENADVSVAVFNASSDLIYADQTVASNGVFEFKFASEAPSEIDRIIVASPDESKTVFSADDMTVNTGVDNKGVVTIDGSLPGAKNTNVSLAVFNEESDLVYADQVVAIKGIFKFKFIPTFPVGIYRAVVSSADESKSVSFEYSVAGDGEIEGLESLGNLQFAESFDGYTDYWDARNLAIRNGAATATDGEGYKRVLTNFASVQAASLWDNCIITLKLSYDKLMNKESHWLGLDLNVQNYNDAHHLYFFQGGTYGQALGSSQQKKLSDFVMKMGTVYDLKIVQRNNKITAYAKDENDSRYECIGEFDADLSKRGGLGISSMNRHFTVDDICVYSLNDELSIKKPIIAMSGDEFVLPLASYDGVTLSTSNSGVVAIKDQSSKTLRASSAGTAEITVSYNNKTEKVPIIVRSRTGNFSLSSHELILSEGEAEDIKVSSGSVDQNVEWTVSDESVISVYGQAYNKKTLCAKKEGRAALYVKCGNYTDVCYVTVNAAGKCGEKPVLLQLSGQSRPVSQTMMGVHNPLAGFVNTTNTFNYDIDKTMLKEAGVTLIRGPEGGAANYYRWKTGDLSIRPLASGYKGVFLDDIFKNSNDLNLPYCFAINVEEQTVDEIAEEVRAIKDKVGGRQIFIELGNENYDMFTNSSILAKYPTPKSYVDKCGEAYKAIKKIDSSIKVGIPIAVNWLNRRLTGVPYISGNASMVGWNKYIEQHPEYYDAVIPHYYSSIDSMTGLTEKEMMEALNAFNAETLRECYEHGQQYPGKEIWVTEYGSLFSEKYQQTDVNESNRYQTAKAHGDAIDLVEKIMNMMKSGNVTIASLHQFISGNGFGLVQRDGEDLIRLPKFYTFKELSSIVKEFPRIFDVDMLYGVTKTVSAGYISPGDTETIHNVEAWGFGTDSSIAKVVISNHSDTPTKIRLDGYDMAVEWSYGGDHPLGRRYLQTDDYWYDADPGMLLPDTTKGESVGEITVPEYTMVVCSLSRNTEQGSFTGLAEGDGSTQVSTTNGVNVFSNGQGIQISVLKNGEVIPSTVTKAGSMYNVKASYEYDTQYEIKVSENGQDRYFTFVTEQYKPARSLFTATANATSSGFNVTFSALVNEENIKKMVLTENGQSVPFIATGSGSSTRIVPEGGFRSGFAYKLSDGGDVLSQNGRLLKSFMCSYIAPMTEIEPKDGIIKEDSGANYTVELDLDFDDITRDSVSLQTGNNTLMFFSNGIKLAKGAEKAVPIVKYDLSKNSHIKAIVGGDGEVAVYAYNSAADRDEKILSEQTAYELDGTVKVTATGSGARYSEVKYCEMPDARMTLEDATEYEADFKLELTGPVNALAVNNQSVRMYCDGAPVKCDVVSCGNNCYDVYVKGIVDGGNYTAVICNNAKAVNGMPVPKHTLSADTVNLRHEKVYVIDSDYDISGDTVKSEFTLRNNTDSTKNVAIIQAVYEGEESNELLVGVKIQNVSIQSYDAKTIPLRIYVNDDGKEKNIKTLFFSNTSSIEPFCDAEIMK